MGQARRVHRTVPALLCLAVGAVPSPALSLNCTAFCKYYVECMCGQPLPTTAACLACVNKHQANFNHSEVQRIPCSYARAKVLCGQPQPSPSPKSNGTIFVSSVNGSDSNSGLAPSAPLLSLHHAIDVVVEQRATRLLLSGLFVLNQTVALTAQHRGLTVMQWPGKPAAVISGGIDLLAQAWKRDPEDPSVWTTSLPTAAAVALSAQGSGAIYVGGQRRSISRTKTLKWAAPLGPKNSAVSLRGFVYAEQNQSDPFAGWSLDANHLAEWRVAAYHSWTKAYHTVAAIFPQNRTILFAEKAMFGYGSYLYCSQARFYVENAVDIALEPGSWRVEAATTTGTAMLYYKPALGEVFPPTAGSSVVVPSLETLVQLNGAHTATLQGLKFIHAGSGDCGTGLGIACDRDEALMAKNALDVVASTNVTLANLRLQSLGGFGISAASSAGLVIDHISVVDVGAGAIFVRSCDGVLVNNSIVAGYGQRFPAASGITMTTSRNGSVLHCDVSGGLFSGLAGGGTDDGGAYSRFELNHVHGLGSEADDGICDFGGYHGSTGGSKLPVFMTSNIFHNITAFANGGSGIYMDVSSTAWQVNRNLVYDVNNAGIHWNVNPGVPQVWGPGATPTRITNNVVIADRDNSYYRAHAMASMGGPTHEPYGLGNAPILWHGYRPATFERNVIIVDSTHAPSRGAWMSGVPCAQEEHLAPGCTYDLADSFKGCTVSSNVWFNRTGGSDSFSSTFPGGCNVTSSSCGVPFARGCACRSWTQWTAAGMDRGSLWQIDPKLTGPLHLVSGKEALALGIEPLTELALAGADWEL